MSKITSYRDLIVWQKAMSLTELVYRLTEKFPRSELFGISQAEMNEFNALSTQVGELAHGLLRSLDARLNESPIPNPKSHPF